QGGVQPAVRVAHRKPVFVSEVLVYFDGVCVGACNVWICGQEIRGNKRIIVIRGKSSQGFQYACGLVQWPRDLIVGERLPLESVGGRSRRVVNDDWRVRSEEHTSELQSLAYLVCRLLLEKKKKKI